jgi:hypothetical protein
MSSRTPTEQENAGERFLTPFGMTTPTSFLPRTRGRMKEGEATLSFRPKGEIFLYPLFTKEHAKDNEGYGYFL